MPYYAVEAIIKRVKDTDKNGYIWDTTGSGKTLASFSPTPTPSCTPIALTPEQKFLIPNSNPRKRVFIPKKNVAVPEFRTAAQA